MFPCKYKVLTFAVLAELFWPNLRVSAQIAPETFDCGTIGLSTSGKSKMNTDLGRGFRFEFPLRCQQIGVTDPFDDPCPLHCPSDILIDALLSKSDPKFYASQGGRVTGTETINGIKWVSLTWPDGRRGYYSYRNGAAVEFVSAEKHLFRIAFSPATATCFRKFSNSCPMARMVVRIVGRKATN